MAAEIVRDYQTIGNVARAMILQGMKECVRQTFGEEAVEKFGEDTIGGGSRSSGGSGKKVGGGKLDLEWDTTNKGPVFKLSDDKRSFSTGSNYEGWNCILSSTSFSEGVHYVEVHLDKTGDSGFLFYGVGTPDNIPYSQCIGGAQSCMVAGYDARFVQTSHQGEVKHDRVDEIQPFTKPQFVGLLIDMEKKELHYVLEGKEPLHAYSSIPSKVHIFACAAHNITMTFTKHITGRSNIEKYLKNLESNQKDYQMSEWVNQNINN